MDRVSNSHSVFDDDYKHTNMRNLNMALQELIVMKEGLDLQNQLNAQNEVNQRLSGHTFLQEIEHTGNLLHVTEQQKYASIESTQNVLDPVPDTEHPLPPYQHTLQQFCNEISELHHRNTSEFDNAEVHPDSFHGGQYQEHDALSMATQLQSSKHRELYDPSEPTGDYHHSNSDNFDSLHRLNHEQQSLDLSGRHCNYDVDDERSFLKTEQIMNQSSNSIAYNHHKVELDDERHKFDTKIYNDAVYQAPSKHDGQFSHFPDCHTMEHVLEYHRQKTIVYKRRNNFLDSIPNKLSDALVEYPVLRLLIDEYYVDRYKTDEELYILHDYFKNGPFEKDLDVKRAMVACSRDPVACKVYHDELLFEMRRFDSLEPHKQVINMLLPWNRECVEDAALSDDEVNEIFDRQKQKQWAFKRRNSFLVELNDKLKGAIVLYPLLIQVIDDDFVNTLKPEAELYKRHCYKDGDYDPENLMNQDPNFKQYYDEIVRLGCKYLREHPSHEEHENEWRYIREQRDKAKDYDRSRTQPCSQSVFNESNVHYNYEQNKSGNNDNVEYGSSDVFHEISTRNNSEDRVDRHENSHNASIFTPQIHYYQPSDKPDSDIEQTSRQQALSERDHESHDFTSAKRFRQLSNPEFDSEECHKDVHITKTMTKIWLDRTISDYKGRVNQLQNTTTVEKQIEIHHTGCTTTSYSNKRKSPYDDNKPRNVEKVTDISMQHRNDGSNLRCTSASTMAESNGNSFKSKSRRRRFMSNEPSFQKDSFTRIKPKYPSHKDKKQKQSGKLGNTKLDTGNLNPNQISNNSISMSKSSVYRPRRTSKIPPNIPTRDFIQRFYSIYVKDSSQSADVVDNGRNSSSEYQQMSNIQGSETYRRQKSDSGNDVGHKNGSKYRKIDDKKIKRCETITNVPDSSNRKPVTVKTEVPIATNSNSAAEKNETKTSDDRNQISNNSISMSKSSDYRQKSKVPPNIPTRDFIQRLYSNYVKDSSQSADVVDNGRNSSSEYQQMSNIQGSETYRRQKSDSGNDVGHKNVSKYRKIDRDKSKRCETITNAHNRKPVTEKTEVAIATNSNSAAEKNTKTLKLQEPHDDHHASNSSTIGSSGTILSASQLNKKALTSQRKIDNSSKIRILVIGDSQVVNLTEERICLPPGLFELCTFSYTDAKIVDIMDKLGRFRLDRVDAVLLHVGKNDLHDLREVPWGIKNRNSADHVLLDYRSNLKSLVDQITDAVPHLLYSPPLPQNYDHFATYLRLESEKNSPGKVQMTCEDDPKIMLVKSWIRFNQLAPNNQSTKYLTKSANRDYYNSDHMTLSQDGISQLFRVFRQTIRYTFHKRYPRNYEPPLIDVDEIPTYTETCLGCGACGHLPGSCSEWLYSDQVVLADTF